jgi:hypothetical protein
LDTNNSSKSKQEAAEMWFLRLVARVTLLGQKRRKDISEDLKIFQLTDKVDHITNWWKQHLKRMEDNCIPKKIYNHKL